jgi:hypothetical protein
MHERNRVVGMEMSFFGSVLPWFKGVAVSKRRTQAATLVLRLMGRCVGLKRPCTGPYLEGRAKKDIPMLGPLGSVTNSHRALANGQERHIFKELKCYTSANIIWGTHRAGDRQRDNQPFTIRCGIWDNQGFRASASRQCLGARSTNET